jgi:hypothetical protein
MNDEWNAPPEFSELLAAFVTCFTSLTILVGGTVAALALL